MKFPLIHESRQVAEIRFFSDAETLLGSALEDFVSCLHRATGVHPQFNTPFEGKRAEFRVETTLEKRLRDGFRFVPFEEGIRVEASRVEGIRNALYWLLHHELGCRWFWPGTSGEYVPPATTFAISIIEQEVVPHYEWRWLGPGGPVWHEADVFQKERELGVLPETQQSFRLWCARNLLGGPSIADGHRFLELADPRKIGRDHPEFFALVDGIRQTQFVDGKHGNQLCTSNPDAVDFVARQVCRYFEDHPEVEVFSISPNDGGGFCECRQCRAQDSEAGRNYDFRRDLAYLEDDQKISTRVLTDRLFAFANEVGRRVEAKLPERKLLLLIYGPYRNPPVGSGLAGNIVAQFCCQCSNYSSATVRNADYQLARDLMQKTDLRGIYEYYDQGSWNGSVRIFPEEIEQSIRFYHQCGFTFYSSQASYGFATNGLNLLTMARCLWDVSSTAAGTLEDFCQSAFGPAHAAMKQYYMAWIGRWKEVVAGHTKEVTTTAALGADMEDFVTLYPDSFRKARACELQTALEDAAGNAPVCERIAFVGKGLEYTSLLCAAMEKTLFLEAQDISSGKGALLKQLSDNSEAAIDRLQADFDQAVEAWNMVEEFVESHKNEPVLSYFWVRYHRDVRLNGSPLKDILLKREKINAMTALSVC